MTAAHPLAPLEAISEALGEQLGDLSGFRFTRLTGPVAKGDTVFPVETTLGWPAAGAFVIDGIAYRYAAKTDFSFTGVTWPDVGLTASAELSPADPAVQLTVVAGSNLAIEVAGGFLGTLAFEATTDGTTWLPLSVTPVGGGSPVTGANVPGKWSAPLTLELYARVTATLSNGSARTSITVTSGTGARQAHAVASHVLDTSRTYSTLDLTRARFLVDTAVGDDLNVIGRNIGVTRPPNLHSDDAFREVIKTIAYMPKGTLYGIELALTAFFGAGNFEVWENFPTSRCTVFIRLRNGLGLSTSALGRSYLSVAENQPLDVGLQAVSVLGPVLTVRGVRIADEEGAQTFESVLPSDPMYLDTRYLGDTGIPVWTFDGSGVEGSTVAVTPDAGATLTNPGAVTTAYQRTARIRPESRAALTVTLRALSLPSAVDGRQCMLNLRDGARDLAAGLLSNGFSADVGFVNASTGAYLTGAAATLPAGDYRDIGIRKNADVVELLVDGVVVQTAAASAFATTTLNEFRWGLQLASVSASAAVKGVAFWATTDTDYWNTAGTGGTTLSASPQTFNTHSGEIQPGDVGRAFRTATSSGYGSSRNNGLWRVASVVDTDSVTLIGTTRSHAFVESGRPGRISFSATPDPLVYPDDLGKTITIEHGPAAGTYTITQLLDEHGVQITGLLGEAGVPRADSGATLAARPAAACVVSGAPVTWVTSAGLDWHLNPAFVTDSGLSWEIVAVGTRAGADLTLRDVPPLDIPPGYDVIVTVGYTQVHGGQLLPTSDVQNLPLGAGAWEWYPLYLPPNPMGPYAAFLKDLTVAGVFPELVLG